MLSLFTLNIQAQSNNKRIAFLRLSLDSHDNLSELLSSQKPLSYIYSAYPNSTNIEIAFLSYWSTLKKDAKKNNSILFTAPFPQELIYFIGQITCSITIDNTPSQSLLFTSKAFSPKISLDIANSIISLSHKEESFLIPSIIPYIIYKNHISPLHMLFRATTTDTLFTNGSCTINVSESNFLIEELQHQKSSLNKYITIPKIIDSEHITPIFEFHYNKNQNKYELSLFLEVLVESHKKRFPLNLESAKKFLNSHVDFAINGDNNSTLLIKKEHPICKNIEKIVETCFQNFYSVLGEIEDNKIITNDKANFFEGFLPKISQNTEIYQVGKKNKLQFILAQEKPNINISNITKNPLFANIDWLAVTFEYNHNNIKLSLADLEKIIINGFIEIDNKLISLPEDDIDPIKKLLELRKNKTDTDLNIQASFLPWILFLYPEATIPIEWQELKDFINLGTLPHIVLPNQSVLREYQRLGVERLSLLYKFGFGMILADEMGLGKTLQILALLDINKGKGKTIIITPTALLLNWIAEIQKFYPDCFKVLLVNGSKQNRDEKLKDIDNYDIIITSYHMLGFDMEYYQNIEFDFCIIDEAQHIKNSKSKRSKSVKQINAHTKIAVSGTPLENNIAELWSIFDFIMPGFLGTSKEFQHNFEDPLLRFDPQQRKSTLNKLYQICAPFIIRRTKDKVYKELPPKIEQTIITELTTKQKSLYLNTLSKVRDQFQTVIQNNNLSSSHIDFLSALTKLRQISLHPALIYPELENEDPELYSSKMTALLELLDDALESNHRILIFSQFVSMLKLIKKELLKRQIEHLYIDGKTTNRIQLTDDFNNGTTPVFLISLRAGGVGLNLTGADTVILFDPWWNPSVENQAIDRAHRIGQHKVVNIYRLMTKGTIEEKIFNLQRKKDFLFDNIMQENSDFGAFSSEELLSLLNTDDSLFEEENE